MYEHSSIATVKGESPAHISARRDSIGHGCAPAPETAASDDGDAQLLSAGITDVALIIDAASPDLAILGRTPLAAALVPPHHASLHQADCLAPLAFEDLRSRLLLVAAGAAPQRGMISWRGDPTASRRPATIAKPALYSRAAELSPETLSCNEAVLLVLGPVTCWREADGWQPAVQPSRL
ncbi:MAG TPA: hypothetical protein VM639_12615 [Dongiaceae bacterium]|nr:hypothetical protein [Dongiaceae bacterium]